MKVKTRVTVSVRNRACAIRMFGVVYALGVVLVVLVVLVTVGHCWSLLVTVGHCFTVGHARE